MRGRSIPWIRVLVAVAVAIIALPLIASVVRLAIPAPSGPHAIGRMRLSWTDPSRSEHLTAVESDRREVIAEVWYPARARSGHRAPYFPDLTRVAAGLARSGEINRFQAWGLRFVRAHGRAQAAPADAVAPFPVVVLSPGNATNAEFYASFSEDLASHGFVVVGINHPYDVGAVALDDGSIAVLAPTDSPGQEFTAVRVVERVADVRFTLDRLAELNEGAGPLAGRLDLARIGVMGHSLGGLAAAQACVADARFDACLNLDGLQDGGPFSVKAGEPIPQQPFLFITKEAALHPRLEALLATVPTYSRVIIPEAAHRDFSDGPLFEPAFLPLPRTIDRVHEQVRRATREFFQQVLA